jgi:hypothetical protein
MALPSVSGEALPGRNGATSGAWRLNLRATPAASLKGLWLGASGLGVQRQECLVAGGDVSLIGRLGDGALAHPLDHGCPVEQDLRPGLRGPG